MGKMAAQIAVAIPPIVVETASRDMAQQGMIVIKLNGLLSCWFLKQMVITPQSLYNSLKAVLVFCENLFGYILERIQKVIWICSSKAILWLRA